MTGQELYERLAAGYDYDPMYAEVITERDKLRDENAKLREELEAVGTDAYLYGRNDLAAENAKLRELVRDMWREGEFEAGACYEKAAERLEEKTRELGIEVS